MRVLALVPARGGSKGIPKKNIREIAGKPLIAWTIEAARASNVSSVVVSTDNAEIARVATEYGAEVPFLRPANLSLDETPSISVVMHALDNLPNFDALLLLQPTSPLRSTEDINNCLTKVNFSGGTSIVSVVESPAHPNWTYMLSDEKTLIPYVAHSATRRQDLLPVFTLNGAIYLADVKFIRENKSFLGSETFAYLMPQERSVDIDNYFDWRIAEMLLSDRQRKTQ
jgi:N-acylneuraminate cytidylyltransferase/CMP-N,N'-diacetyllegionaminic acid synthase